MTSTDDRLLSCIALVVALATACRPTIEIDGLRQVPPFVDRVWLSTDRAAAPGTIRVFLPDGTLVLDSCVETYRLARWTAIDANRIAWDEDGARIEAEIRQVSPDELEIRLHLVKEVKEERYRLAAVPYVCAELRSSPSGAGR
jgi:hypothetical protein